MRCDQLSKAAITADTDTVTIHSASLRTTDKGAYCRVLGSIGSATNFAGDLPVDRWTQRLVQGAQGREGVEHAFGCQPALNGEIAVVTQAGGPGGPGNPSDPAAATWGVPPQDRINAAYLSQHLTAVAFKAVVNAFYGQRPRYSYMLGCSGGGYQTLMEAERFPQDFDGYSIGAPPMFQTVHDLGFWHGWEYHVNRRPDGSIILHGDKLLILHDAAIAHCAQAAGRIDDDLQQPTACRFSKAWVQCKPGAADASKCLTADEARVAEQLYLGPNDGIHFFEVSGYPLGSELMWRLSSPGQPADGEGQSPHSIHTLLMPPESGRSTAQLMADFSFSQQWYDKTLAMRPMFNAANSDLRALQRRGGKIILWNGAQDNVVQPAGTIAYYQAVQKEMGAGLTDSFLRFFLLPGMGHCGSGDGANQVDTLSPMMAWVETGRQPVVLVAGKPTVPDAPPGGGGRGGPGGPGGWGRQQPGAVPDYPPYASGPKDIAYTRPVYPFPYVAKYDGKGNLNDAGSYIQVKGPLQTPQHFTGEAAALIGPDNQKFYKAEADRLVVVPNPPAD